MEWKGRRQSDNIEDRRTSAPDSPGNNPFGRGNGVRIPIGRGSGGLGIGGIIMVLVVCWLLGINPMTLLDGSMSSSGVQQESSETPSTPANDEMTAFVRTVLAETEDTWQGIFAASGETYEDPKLVLFSGQTESSCGAASSASGPFYCPSDRKVYLDTQFFQQLQQQFGASGDFAEAYVIAHEVGHHVQNLTGIADKVRAGQQQADEAGGNALQVKMELQADCYAGVWAANNRDRLEPGDIEEGMRAAQAIGDDTLQKSAGRTPMPDSFTHGTSAERMAWLKRGLDSGDPAQCDTFTGAIDR